MTPQWDTYSVAGPILHAAGHQGGECGGLKERRSNTKSLGSCQPGALRVGPSQCSAVGWGGRTSGVRSTWFLPGFILGALHPLSHVILNAILIPI